MSTQKGWHNMDIIAAVKKKTGLSLRQLSLANNSHESTAQQALHRPFMKAELMISKAIGVPAHIIWPDRYLLTGERKNGRKRQLNVSQSETK